MSLLVIYTVIIQAPSPLRRSYEMNEISISDRILLRVAVDVGQEDTS